MRDAQVLFGALLHGAGHVDEQQDTALAQPALQPAQRHHVAVVADRFAQGPPRVEVLAAARAHAPVTGTARQMRGRRTGEAPQHLMVALRSKAPHRQRLGGGCVLPGFVDLVGDERLGAARALFLNPHRFVLGLAERLALLHFAKKVHSEQRIECGAPVRRWRERRMRGAADVGDRSRAE